MPGPRTARLIFDPQPDPESLLDNLSAVAFSNGHLWVAGDECNGDRNTIERLTWNPAAGGFDRHVRYDVGTFFNLPAGPVHAARASPSCRGAVALPRGPAGGYTRRR